MHTEIEITEDQLAIDWTLTEEDIRFINNNSNDGGLHKKTSIPEVMLWLKKWRIIEYQNGKSRFTEISKSNRVTLRALNVQIPLQPSY